MIKMETAYLPRLINVLEKNHDFSEVELELIHRLEEICYDGKIELWNDYDIKRYHKAFGNMKKWQVEDGDFKSYPFKATSMGTCSDTKTREEAQELCDEWNERDEKNFKWMR